MSDSWDDYEPEEEEIEVTQGPRRRRRGNESRGSWYILTGLILGLGIGLVIAWVISPVKYTDTAPASLATNYKDEYRRAIALAYASNHNLERARERLKLIDTNNPAQALAAQAKRMLAEKQPAQEARALAVLAADLGQPPSAQLSSTEVAGAQTLQVTIEEATATAAPTIFATIDAAAAVQTPTRPAPTNTPTATFTPAPTFTSRPTMTALPTSDVPFVLKSKKEVCGATVQPGLLQIEVKDAGGNPIPGVRIVITWKEGEDSFYTGLSPEIDAGYADFHMKASTSYDLKIGNLSRPVNEIAIPSCGGGWKLDFVESKQ